MSTKIFDAWLLPDDTDVLDLSRELYAAAAFERDQLDTRVVLEQATEVVDRWWLAHNTDPGTAGHIGHPVRVAAGRLEAEQAGMHPAHALHDPHRFTAVFLQHPVTGAKVVKVFRLGEHYQAMLHRFARTWGWSEFGYWNHVDRPAELSAAQWQGRREFWDQILAPHGNYAHGLHCTLPTTRLDRAGIRGRLTGPQTPTLTPRARLIGLLLPRALHAARTAQPGADLFARVVEQQRRLEEAALGPWLERIPGMVHVDDSADRYPAHYFSEALLDEILDALH